MTSKPHVHSCGHAHSHAHSNGTTGIAADDSEDSGKRSKKKKPTRDLTAEFDKIRMFLEAHFGTVSDLRTELKQGAEDEDELLTLDVELDGVKASVDLISMVSGCASPARAAQHRLRTWNDGECECIRGSSI